jgi:hypothetical protein
MISAVALVFQLVKTALTGQSEATLLATVLNDAQLLVLFAILLAYHLTVLRRDGRSAAQALADKQSLFKLLVVDSGQGFAASVKGAVAKLAPNIPVTVATGEPTGEFNALVVSGSRLLDAPQWIRAFGGSRIVVPDEAEGVLWAGGLSASSIQKAALAVRQLAEGQAVRQRAAGSGWMVVVYIAAALFAAELLFALVGLTVSAFVR